MLRCKKCRFEFYINALPCNAVLIENEKGEILLVKRKFDPKKGYWDWPGGFLDSYESLKDSIKREIKEELGVKIELEKFVGAYSDTYLFQNINNPVIVLVMAGKIKGEIKVSDDVSGYKYFSKKDIFKQKLAFASMRIGLRDYITGKS
nr:NUDIX domain-containing protein [Candidatus Levybacteria bacterium]